MASPFLYCSACLNYYYGVDKHGKLSLLDDDWQQPFNIAFNREQVAKRAKTLEAKLKKTGSFMALSDYAVCLMKLGKPKEALDILKLLYNSHPSEYRIAANLGTAYELNGLNDSALKYIRRDMTLNPDDHHGSEWVHVKVLEAKLKLQQNPAYLVNHTVLSLTEKKKNDSVTFYHLLIQLRERVPFMPNKDKIMASLFTDLGDIAANIKSIEYAKNYYQIAQKYYGDTSAKLFQKIKEMQALKTKFKEVQPSPRRYGKEGEHNKVAFSYKQLIPDNGYARYKVNWNTINTNVASLIALVH